MTNTNLTRRGLIGAGALAGLAAIVGWPSRDAAAATRRFAITRTPAEWRKRLGAARFNILRNQGTEVPFTSPLNGEKRKGIYVCAGCALPLFSSATKFDSGTGWPSFYAALPNAVGYTVDRSMMMKRTEEHCSRCGGHLGHVFDDGPRPTGKRHCINGLSLAFRAT